MPKYYKDFPFILPYSLEFEDVILSFPLVESSTGSKTMAKTLLETFLDLSFVSSEEVFRVVIQQE